MRIYDKLLNIENLEMVLLRSLVAAEVIGYRLPEELKDVRCRTVSKEKRAVFRNFTNNRPLLHAITLFADGVISEKTLIRASNFAGDCTDVILSAENYILANLSNEHRFTDSTIENAVLMCLNSIEYPEIENTDFETALKLNTVSGIRISDGKCRPADFGTFQFLLKTGFSFITINNGKIETEERENLVNFTEEEPPDFDDEISPFIAEQNRLYYVMHIYGKPFDTDFIEYADKNGIAFNKDILSEYERYISTVRLHFEITVYKKLRNICDEVCWFDYMPDVPSGIEEIKPVPFDLKATDKNEPYELAEKAAREYLTNNTTDEHSVIKIHYNSEDYYFCYADGKLTNINDLDFHKIPFNFGAIWRIIIENSKSGNIKLSGNTVKSPAGIWNEIPEDQWKYAERILEEQVRLWYKERMESNRILRTLDSIKKQSHEEYERRQLLKQQQGELKAERKGGYEE